MLGYLRSVGFAGIQPFWRPAEYDQSSADSVFHVHCIQPPAFSNVITFPKWTPRDLHSTASCKSIDSSHSYLAHLCFPCLPQEVLVVLSTCRTWACLAVATAMDRRALPNGPIVPCADATAIEVFRAICHSRRPLANNRQHLIIVEIGQGCCISTCRVDMPWFVERYSLRW
jgi:hypothetical protein